MRRRAGPIGALAWQPIIVSAHSYVKPACSTHGKRLIILLFDLITRVQPTGSAYRPGLCLAWLSGRQSCWLAGRLLDRGCAPGPALPDGRYLRRITGAGHALETPTCCVRRA